VGESTEETRSAIGDKGVGCEPHLVAATATEYELRNNKKALNFIIGELVQGGQLSFIVENLPKDGTGCRGIWMFHELMQHLGTAVTAIQGNWTYGDNLAVVNQLTAGGSSLEDAAKQGFTGKRAAEWGFLNVRVLPQTQGTAGRYLRVHVLLEK
jgi:hypothetical protein